MLYGLISLSTLGAATRVDYLDYLAMSPEQRQKLEKQYVKENAGLFNLKLQSYEVFCNVSAEKTLEIAIAMDDFYRQFNSKFTGSFRKNKAPKIYVMADKKSYEKAIFDFSKYTPPDWSAGLFVSAKSGALFCNMDYGEQVIQTMKHEGTHQLLDAYIDGSILTWFNEGTATVFETFQMDQSMVTNVQMNFFDSSYPYVFAKEGAEKRIPLKELFALDGKAWSNTKDPTLQYASAWVVVNYLLTTENGLKIYNQVLSAQRNHQKTDKLFSSKSLEDLDKMISNHTLSALQNAKFGRPLEEARKKHQYKAMRQGALKYSADFPDSPEAKFYEVLSGLLDTSSSTPQDTLEQLAQLEKNGYGHPQMDYAYTLAHRLAGNESKADYSLRHLLANMPRHSEALELQRKK